jgi:hypothetical protein
MFLCEIPGNGMVGSWPRKTVRYDPASRSGARHRRFALPPRAGGQGAIALAPPGLGGVLVFGVLYLAVAWGLGCGEGDELAARVRHRLRRCSPLFQR